MFKDWYLAAFCLVAAMVIAGFAVYASVEMTEAFQHSEPATFSKECLDEGGRASYNEHERLVCVVDGQVISVLEGVR